MLRAPCSRGLVLAVAALCAEVCSGVEPSAQFGYPLIHQPFNGNVGSVLVSSDAHHAVYTTSSHNGRSDVFSVLLEAPFTNRRLNGALVAGGGFGLVLISPDGSRVVYVADQDTDNVVELYSAPIDGSAPAVKLNGPLVPGGDVLVGQFTPFRIRISPDSSRVVYLVDQNIDQVAELYSAPLDGSAPAVRLNAPLVAGGNVSGRFEISDDSATVVYVADQEVDERARLYRVPIDGSAPPTRLNPPMVPGGSVSFERVVITPGSSRVIYRADQLEDERIELFSVPFSGSGTVLKLNAPLVTGGDVLDFQLSPDASRIVYLADQSIDGVNELFSVPVDGSAAPVRLDAPPVAGGNVTSFDFSPDSQRVVYLADQDTDEVVELFSVKADGSAGPAKLSGALLPGRDVRFFRVSPDSSEVLFIDADSVGRGNELYGVPIDASLASFRLHPALPAGRYGVGVFQIDARSRQVVFTSDAAEFARYEVFSSQLDGSRLAQKLNPALVPGGRVVQAVITPDASRVVYSAAQEAAYSVELFLTALAPRARR